MKSRVEKGINTQIKAEAYMLIAEVIAAPSPTSSSFLSAFSDLSFLLPLYSSSLPWLSADADCKPSPILVIVGGLSVRRAFRIHLPSHYHHEHGAKALPTSVDILTRYSQNSHRNVGKPSPRARSQ
jgi:hypothetical protein